MTDFSIPAEFDFGQQFDRATLTRAMALEPERALLSMQIDGPMLLTRLRGSGAQAYEQRIELPVDRRLGLQVRGRCTCAVGFNCKHVAAALMAFEAFQIRREKNPQAAHDQRIVVRTATPLSAAAPTAQPTDLPSALTLWLGELAHTATGPARAAAAAVPALPGASAVRRLMYVMRPQGTRLHLQLHLGVVRRTGEIGSHRRHVTAPADMLRSRPAYLGADDPALLAALLPLQVLATAAAVVLYGPTAAATAQEIGRAHV